MKARILDLFCGAGGASEGYARAGFAVTGVDIADQPNYPWELYVEDALSLLESAAWHRGTGRDHALDDFDAIHASPPCQQFTAYRRTGTVGEYPDLIHRTRELLKATGLPFVIENVPGAPLREPVRLCGTSFGLDVQRHRLFETNFSLMTSPCAHGAQRPTLPAGH